VKTTFAVYGPCEVPVYQGAGGRTITTDEVRVFWQSNSSVAKSKGCYVFAMRAGKGFSPYYVGKATKGFKQEAFSPHKLTKYQQCLADYRRGTPVMFFVVASGKKGGNTAHIGELEGFLIQVGLTANPYLLNVKGTKAEDWGITGVLRGGKGKPSQDARQFRRLMKI